jgi:hypothetical protein
LCSGDAQFQLFGLICFTVFVSDYADVATLSEIRPSFRIVASLLLIAQQPRQRCDLKLLKSVVK